MTAFVWHQAQKIPAERLCPQLGAEFPLADEAYIARRMVQLIERITVRNAKKSQVMPGIVRRFNQAKTLGYFDVQFEVLEGLPDSLAHGLFAKPGQYPAVMRFASASTDNDMQKDLRGVSLKVMQVAGDKLWGKSDQQDFIFNSYPVLFAGTPQDFLAFIEATARHRQWWYFVNPSNPHLRALQILSLARTHPTSPFDIPYWSTTPYRLGPQKSVAVKYKLIPTSDYQSELPWRITPNYLRKNMYKHLQNSVVTFDLGVQFQLDAEQMPIEDASVLWPESLSPFHRVARIQIASQDFEQPAVLARAERQSFNPWQCLPDHQPIGGINRVRQRVYAELANFRRQSLSPSESVSSVLDVHVGNSSCSKLTATTIQPQ
jgi:catalase